MGLRAPQEEPPIDNLKEEIGILAVLFDKIPSGFDDRIGRNREFWVRKVFADSAYVQVVLYARGEVKGSIGIRKAGSGFTVFISPRPGDVLPYFELNDVLRAQDKELLDQGAGVLENPRAWLDDFQSAVYALERRFISTRR